jgi:hypothetical protein
LGNSTIAGDAQQGDDREVLAGERENQQQGRQDGRRHDREHHPPQRRQQARAGQARGVLQSRIDAPQRAHDQQVAVRHVVQRQHEDDARQREHIEQRLAQAGEGAEAGVDPACPGAGQEDPGHAREQRRDQQGRRRQRGHEPPARQIGPGYQPRQQQRAGHAQQRDG